VMARTAKRIEDSLKYDQILAQKKVSVFPTIADAISHATCQTALDLKATVILSSTQSGSTARTVSKYRPQAPIVAATPTAKVAQQLTIAWGVYPMIVPLSKNIDSMLDVSIEAAKKHGFIKTKDLIVITAGVRVNEPGSTNLLQVYCVE
jgi:Pyruvate kinase